MNAASIRSTTDLSKSNNHKRLWRNQSQGLNSESSMSEGKQNQRRSRRRPGDDAESGKLPIVGDQAQTEGQEGGGGQHWGQNQDQTARESSSAVTLEQQRDTLLNQLLLLSNRPQLQASGLMNHQPVQQQHLPLQQQAMNQLHGLQLPPPSPQDVAMATAKLQQNRLLAASLVPGNSPSASLIQSLQLQQQRGQAFQPQGFLAGSQAQPMLGQQPYLPRGPAFSSGLSNIRQAFDSSSPSSDAVVPRPATTSPSASLRVMKDLPQTKEDTHVAPSPRTKERRNKNEKPPFNKLLAVHMPCQARGQPNDHTSTVRCSSANSTMNAYFEVDRSSAVHGQHLLCSHPTCRAAGVKFRYCRYCQKPVTKQNFRSRHMHADQADAAKKLESDQDDASKETDAGRESKKRTSYEHGDSKQTSADSITEKKRKVDYSTEAVTSQNKEERDVAVKRRRTWSRLLADRPESLESMGSWLTEVIAASETADNSTSEAKKDETTLLDDTSSSQSGASDLGNWESLLRHRPVDNNGGALTEWIVKIVRTSCPHQRKQIQMLQNDESSSRRDSDVVVDEAEPSPTKREVPEEVAYSHGH